MKIVVNTDNYEILNSIIREAKKNGDEVIIAKLEKKLFELIEYEHEAYIIGNTKPYAQKAIDFIKKHSQYIPVVGIEIDKKELVDTDILAPYPPNFDTDIYARSIIYNINAYIKNFETLQRLTAKLKEPIEFGECKYVPQKRILFHKGELVLINKKKTGKLSPKQGSILELLAANFGKTVKKDIILEKGWGNANYFVGRSLDVFVTHIRNIIRENDINLTLTNVTNVGLLLDHTPKDIN